MNPNKSVLHPRSVLENKWKMIQIIAFCMFCNDLFTGKPGRPWATCQKKLQWRSLSMKWIKCFQCSDLILRPTRQRIWKKYAKSKNVPLPLFIQWWFVNPGSNNPEITLIWTKSAGTDFSFWTDGRFSNPENSLIRKYRLETNLSRLTNHHRICRTVGFRVRVHKIFNLAYNSWTTIGRAFIFHMCIPCDKTFPWVPKFLT